MSLWLHSCSYTKWGKPSRPTGLSSVCSNRIWVSHGAPNSSNRRTGWKLSTFSADNMSWAKTKFFPHVCGKIAFHNPWFRATYKWVPAGDTLIWDWSGRSCHSHTAWKCSLYSEQTRKNLHLTLKKIQSRAINEPQAIIRQSLSLPACEEFQVDRSWSVFFLWFIASEIKEVSTIGLVGAKE